MTAFHQLRRDAPDIARAVDLVDASVRRRRLRSRELILPRTLDFGFEKGGIRQPEQVTATVAGTGAAVRGDRAGELRPALFVHWGADLVGEDFSLAASDRRSLRRSLDLDFDDAPTFDIVFLPHSRAYGAAARSVRAARAGTLGARVHDARGVDCVITAGHVAPRVGEVATSGGRPIGEVVFSVSPQQQPPNVASADVALIDVSNWFDDDGPQHSTEPVAAQLRMMLTAYGAASGVQSAWVKGIVGSYVGEHDTHGDWSDVLVTMGSLSAPGDSGAIVMVEDTDGIVGHVVGGFPGIHSLVQDVTFQLEASGAALR